ncbi:MAG: hypothetical protein NVS3B20_21770 [Polyangiales bacterium]
MAFGKRRERTVYFPWERRGFGRAMQFPRRRATAWLAVIALIAIFAWMNAKNRHQRMVRITRASLGRTHAALDDYRADHDGRCPRDLAELSAPGDRPAYVNSLPLDAWRRPLRFACPSRQATRPYDLLSDGPDGEPYGLDRIE